MIGKFISWFGDNGDEYEEYLVTKSQFLDKLSPRQLAFHNSMRGRSDIETIMVLEERIYNLEQSLMKGADDGK